MAKETVVLDTNVFMGILAGHDLEGRVYSKIIRDCDRIAIDDAVILEYKDTMKRKFVGLEKYLVGRKLSELEAYQKLVRVSGDSKLPDDIDPEDRHLVRAAKEAKAKYLITTDERHLWGHRDHIKNTHRVEVLRPQDYLNLSVQLYRDEKGSVYVFTLVQANHSTDSHPGPESATMIRHSHVFRTTT